MTELLFGEQVAEDLYAGYSPIWDKVIFTNDDFSTMNQDKQYSMSITGHAQCFNLSSATDGRHVGLGEISTRCALEDVTVISLD